MCVFVFVAMWSGLERAYTAQPSGSGRYPHRRLNMWRGSCVSQGERERERERVVCGGYDAGAGSAGMHSRVWFGSNVSGLLRVERENLCCFHAFLNIIYLSHHTLGLRLRALLIIRQTHIVCT